jgi:hypothetical protein
MAIPQTGAQQLAGLKKEAVRGTAELVPDLTIKITNSTIQAQKERTAEEIYGGDRDSMYDEYSTKLLVAGEVTGQIANDQIGDFLFYTLGQATSGAIVGATTAYEHVFDVKNATDIPSFTYFVTKAGAGTYKYNGCIASSLTLEFGETESTFTMSVVGIDEEKLTGTPETNVLAALDLSAPSRKFIFGNLVASRAVDVAGLASATVVNLRPGLTVTFENNIFQDFSSGDASNTILKSYYNGAQNFKPSFSTSGVIVRDSSFRDLFINDTDQAVRFKFEDVGAGNLGDSSTKPTLEITFAKVKLTSQVQTPVAEYLSYDLSGENPTKSFESGVGYSVQIRLTNEKASY